MTLVIMGMEVKEVPIKPKEIEFDMDGKKELYVDGTGRKTKKIQVSASEYKWVYEDGSICSGKTFKAINGKPVKSFTKTAVIDKYDIIDISDLKYFINNELSYLLVNSSFKSRLKEMTGKALVFKYVNRGFKVYRAAAYYDEVLDRAMLRCFRGDLRKANLIEQEAEEIEVATDNVAQLSLDDLEI